MFLDKDIVIYSHNFYRVYKEQSKYYLINQEDELLLSPDVFDNFEKFAAEYKKLEEEFIEYYETNLDSCHHYIGEFRIDSENYEPVAGSFYGMNYFSRKDIEAVLQKLIKCVAQSATKRLQINNIQVLTFYDLDSFKDLEAFEGIIYDLRYVQARMNN